MNPKVSHVLLYVTDMEKSVKFYNEVLGFKKKIQEKAYIEFDTGGAALALSDARFGQRGLKSDVLGTPEDNRRNFSITLGEVEDIDATCEDLRKKGVEFVVPPTDRPWGQRDAYFRDPEGNLLEFFAWVKKE